MCGRSICISGAHNISNNRPHAARSRLTVSFVPHSPTISDFCLLPHFISLGSITPFTGNRSLWSPGWFKLTLQCPGWPCTQGYFVFTSWGFESQVLAITAGQCSNGESQTQGLVHARYAFCSRSHVSWPVFPVHIWMIWNTCLVYMSLHLKIGWFHNTCFSVFVLLYITHYLPGSTYWYMVDFLFKAKKYSVVCHTL